MRLLMMATTIVTTSALTPLLAVDNEPAKRLGEAAAVFSEIMGSPDKGIPQLQGAEELVPRGGMSRPGGSVTKES